MTIKSERAGPALIVFWGAALALFGLQSVQAGFPVTDVQINTAVTRESQTCIWNGQDLKGAFALQCCAAGSFTGDSLASCPQSLSGTAGIASSMIAFIDLLQYHEDSMKLADALTGKSLTALVNPAPDLGPPPPPNLLEFPGSPATSQKAAAQATMKNGEKSSSKDSRRVSEKLPGKAASRP